MMFYVRRVPKRNERQGSPAFRGGLMELCSMEGLFGVRPKSHVG